MYIVKRKKTGLYVGEKWPGTEDMNTAKVYRSVAGAKNSLTRYVWNPELKKSVKTVFEDLYELIPIRISLVDTTTPVAASG